MNSITTMEALANASSQHLRSACRTVSHVGRSTLTLMLSLYVHRNCMFIFTLFFNRVYVSIPNLLLLLLLLVFQFLLSPQQSKCPTSYSYPTFSSFHALQVYLSGWEVERYCSPLLAFSHNLSLHYYISEHFSIIIQYFNNTATC